MSVIVPPVPSLLRSVSKFNVPSTSTVPVTSTPPSVSTSRLPIADTLPNSRLSASFRVTFAAVTFTVLLKSFSGLSKVTS